MPVYVVRFEHQARIRWGVLRDGQILEISGNFLTTGDLLRSVSYRELAGLRGSSTMKTR